MSYGRNYHDEFLVFNVIYDTIRARAKPVKLFLGMEQFRSPGIWINCQRFYSLNELFLNPLGLSRYELLGSRFQFNLVHPRKISNPELIFELVQPHTAGFL